MVFYYFMKILRCIYIVLVMEKVVNETKRRKSGQLNQYLAEWSRKERAEGSTVRTRPHAAVGASLMAPVCT